MSGGKTPFGGEIEPTLGDIARQLQDLTTLNEKQSEKLASVHSLLTGPLDKPEIGLVMRLYAAEKTINDHVIHCAKRGKWWQRQLITFLLGIGATVAASYLVSHWHLSSS